MKLRDYLFEKKIRQADFAELLDIGRTHLSSIVTGARIAGKKVARNVEKETKGEIKFEDMRSGAATGYEGKKRCVRGRAKNLKKDLAKKRISLI